MLKPAQAQIDLKAIKQNVKKVKEFIGPNTDIMAVVKADGYGHGAIEVSPAILQGGVQWLGVYMLAEGVELREAGISAPILVLGAALPEETNLFVKYQLTAAVTNLPILAALNRSAQAHNTIAKVHLKIDTGMGRLGVVPSEVLEFAQQILTYKYLQLEGIFTHFATADEPDWSFAKEQLKRFNQAIQELEQAGIHIPVKHTANSAAILRMPESHFNLVRPGLLVYGLSPFKGSESILKLQPALTLKTKVVQVKQLPAGYGISYGLTHILNRHSIVATISIGYADGYPRALSNKGRVIIGGKIAPILGRVCMDQCMVDVTDIRGVGVGDEVILIGSDNQNTIIANDIADTTGTVVHEIVTRIGKRVPRIFIE